MNTGNNRGRGKDNINTINNSYQNLNYNINNTNRNPLSPYSLTPNYTNSKNNLISDNKTNSTLNLINGNPDKRFYNYFLNNQHSFNQRVNPKVNSSPTAEEYKGKFDGDLYLK